MNIFFFGDSICFGQDVSPHNSWVFKISKSLEALFRKYHTPLLVINSSINGNTTRQALDRMAYDVLSHGVDIIVIQFGMNDCNYWQSDKGYPRVSQKSFEANLHEMIDRAKLFGAQKIYINTNHPTKRTRKFPHAPVSYEESNRQYNRIIRKVAQDRNDVELNDIEKLFRGVSLSDMLLPGSVHPNTYGHQLYFKAILPKLKKSIKELI